MIIIYYCIFMSVAMIANAYYEMKTEESPVVEIAGRSFPLFGIILASSFILLTALV